MSNYTEADVETDTLELRMSINGSQHLRSVRDADHAALARLKSAALEGAKVPGLEQTLENFRKHLEPNQQGVGWEQHVFSAIDTERELLADIERVAPEWSPLNGPHEIVSHLAGKLDEAQSEVAALQARVDEKQGELVASRTKAFEEMQRLQARVAELERVRSKLEKELDARDGVANDLESERDALRAQVVALRKTIDTAGHMLSFSDAGTVQQMLMRALSTPPAATKEGEA